jgi:hypothetical protein
MSLARKMMLAFVIASAVSIIALGAAPASASPSVPNILRAGCVSGYVCFFADSNYSPSGGGSDVLNYSITHVDWSQQNDPAGVCGGITSHTWNDCASSLQSHMQSNMYAWSAAHCSGVQLAIHPGEDIFNLGDFGMNDKISSNKLNNAQPGCS